MSSMNDYNFAVFVNSINVNTSISDNHVSDNKKSNYSGSKNKKSRFI